MLSQQILICWVDIKLITWGLITKIWYIVCLKFWIENKLLLEYLLDFNVGEQYFPILSIGKKNPEFNSKGLRQNVTLWMTFIKDVYEHLGSVCPVKGTFYLFILIY